MDRKEDQNVAISPQKASQNSQYKRVCQVVADYITKITTYSAIPVAAALVAYYARYGE